MFATSGSLDETSTPRALLAIANEPNPDPVWLSLLLHLTMSLILVPTGLEHAAGDALMVLESDLPQLAEAAWEAGQSTDPSQLLRSQLAEYFNGVKNWKHVEGVPPVHKIVSPRSALIRIEFSLTSLGFNLLAVGYKLLARRGDDSAQYRRGLQ